jgi:hypothetical protein
MAAPGYFPARPAGRFPSRSKIAGLRHPPLRFGPPLAPGAGPSRPPAFVAMKAAMVAVQPTEHPMSEHDDYEPAPRLIPDRPRPAELQLYGYRPFEDEPDPGRFPKATSSPAPSPTSSTP